MDIASIESISLLTGQAKPRADDNGAKLGPQFTDQLMGALKRRASESFRQDRPDRRDDGEHLRSKSPPVERPLARLKRHERPEHPDRPEPRPSVEQPRIRTDERRANAQISESRESPANRRVDAGSCDQNRNCNAAQGEDVPETPPVDSLATGGPDSAIEPNDGTVVADPSAAPTDTVEAGASGVGTVASDADSALDTLLLAAATVVSTEPDAADELVDAAPPAVTAAAVGPMTVDPEPIVEISPTAPSAEVVADDATPHATPVVLESPPGDLATADEPPTDVGLATPTAQADTVNGNDQESPAAEVSPTLVVAPAAVPTVSQDVAAADVGPTSSADETEIAEALAAPVAAAVPEGVSPSGVVPAWSAMTLPPLPLAAAGSAAPIALGALAQIWAAAGGDSADSPGLAFTGQGAAEAPGQPPSQAAGKGSMVNFAPLLNAMAARPVAEAPAVVPGQESTMPTVAPAERSAKTASAGGADVAPTTPRLPVDGPGVASAHAPRFSAEALTRPEQPQSPRLPQPVPVAEQIAVRVARAVSEESSKISLQLRPESLGRVDVDLEIHRDGRVTALIVVEKSETLEWLRRDARHLEQALHDAGLKTDSQSLGFSLREHRRDTDAGESRGGFRTQKFAIEGERDRGPDAVVEARKHRIALGGVDVQI
jgi:hypothetical protein